MNESILFVDDHVLIRAGILSILKREFSRYQFWEAGNLSEAKHALEQSSFQLVICDISLGKESGIDLLSAYAQRTPFLMLTFFDESSYAKRCFELGAVGFLNKECSPEELLRTIRNILQQPLLSTPMRKGPLRSCPLDSLSEREREVLEDFANQLGIQEISSKRGISPNTVKTYRKRILEKTHCKNNNELLFFALKQGLIQPPY